MPAGSCVIRAGLHGLIDLGIGEGLVLAFVPAEAAKDAQILSDLLLSVVAQAVFERAEMLVARDVGDSDPILGGVGAIQKVNDSFAVRSHVGAVGVEENSLRAFAFLHE